MLYFWILTVILFALPVGLVMLALTPLFAVLGGSVMLELAVPVLSLVGTLMGLRTARRLEKRRLREALKNDGEARERSDSKLG